MAAHEMIMAEVATESQKSASLCAYQYEHELPLVSGLDDL